MNLAIAELPVGKGAAEGTWVRGGYPSDWFRPSADKSSPYDFDKADRYFVYCCVEEGFCDEEVDGGYPPKRLEFCRPLCPG